MCASMLVLRCAYICVSTIESVCFVLVVLAIIYANRMSTHTKRQVCALTPLEESTRGCSDRPLPWSVENQTWTVHTREEKQGEHARAQPSTRPLGLLAEHMPGRTSTWPVCLNAGSASPLCTRPPPDISCSVDVLGKGRDRPGESGSQRVADDTSVEP